MNETRDKNILYQSKEVTVITECHGNVYTITYKIHETPGQTKCKEMLDVSLKFIRFCEADIILILKSKSSDLEIPSAGACLCVTQFFIEHNKIVQSRLKGVCFKVKQKDEQVECALAGFLKVSPLPCEVMVVDDKEEFADAQAQMISKKLRQT